MKKSVLFFTVLFFSIFAFRSSLISQSIFSVTPNIIKAGDSLNVTVTGIKTNFTSVGAGISFNFFDDFGGYINIKSYQIINDTSVIVHLYAPVNSFKGFKDLIITDNTDTVELKYGKRNAIYTDNPTNSYARITDINPNKGKANQELEVSVTGANTNFNSFIGDSPTGYIDFIDNNNNSNISIDSMSIFTNESMKLFLSVSPFAIQGYNNLVLADSSYIGGVRYFNSYIKYRAFYIESPSCPGIISITPASAVNNQTLNVTIRGKNCYFNEFYQDNLDSISFINKYYQSVNNNDIIINSVQIVNDSLMTANITISPFAKSGFRDLYISDKFSAQLNYGISDGFWVGPYLSSITPDTTSPDQVITTDMTTVNANYSGSKYLKVWLGNPEGYYQDIVGTNINIKGPQLISATFNIPADVLQGLWDVYIADDSDGVFYRTKILKIGQVETVNTISRQKEIIFKTYPNPFNNDLFIEYKLESETPVSIDIYNITGEKIYSLNLGNKPKGNNKEKIITQKNFSEGIYFLKLNNGVNSYISKIVKY